MTTTAPTTASTLDTAAVLALYRENPHASLRWLAQRLGLTADEVFNTIRDAVGP